jgi:hypothetical protein
MALSNILNEPRREITESMIGIGLITIPIIGDYAFARWLEGATTGSCPWPLGMLVGLFFAVLIIALGSALILGSHALGEAICNKLQEHGIHLRPRQRIIRGRGCI